jgi:hypothetical protein
MKKILLITCALILGSAASLKAADAKEIWAKDCAKCHGEDGKGKTKMGEKLGVKDYTDAKVQADLKEDKMAKSIKEGIKDGDKTKMKAFSDLSPGRSRARVQEIKPSTKCCAGGAEQAPSFFAHMPPSQVQQMRSGARPARGVCNHEPQPDDLLCRLPKHNEVACEIEV